MLRCEVIRHSQVNSSLFNMKVISKQPLWRSVIPETGHTYTDTDTYIVILRHTHIQGQKPQAEQYKEVYIWEKRSRLISITLWLYSSDHLLFRVSYFSPFSWFSFHLSLRRWAGVLLMAVVINSYLLSVHIFPSIPLSTLLSICLSPYHFPFSTISLSLPSLSPSLSLHITSLCPSNPALPPFTLFHC